MCRCLYNINGYDCKKTKPELCFETLETKFRMPITLSAHRELFPVCVKYINEKDPVQYGPKALVLMSASPSDKKHGESSKFHVDLPRLKFNSWKAFIDEKGNKIDPFQLACYLNEKWREKRIKWEELTPREQRNLIRDAGKITDHFMKFYVGKDNFEIMRSLLEPVLKDVQTLGIGQEKKEIGQEIRALLQNKKWAELHDYIIGVRKDHFPLDFINYLSEMETLAAEGVKYLEAKNKLIDLVSDEKIADPSHIVHECSKVKNILLFLFSNVGEFETKENIDEPRRLSERTYKKILALLDIVPELEKKYKQLNRFENELDKILPYKPKEWGLCRRKLEKDFSLLYQAELDDILKKKENLEEIEEAVNDLENRIHQNIDFVGTIIHVDAIKRSLEKLSQNFSGMEKLLAQEDPWAFLSQDKFLNELEIGIESLKPTISQWAVYGSLKTKFRFTLDVATQTKELMQEVVEFLNSVKTESSKILFFDLTLNIDRYRHKIDTTIERIEARLRVYKNIKFLVNLQEIAREIKQTIFPDAFPLSKAKETGSLIPSTRENAAKGDKIYNAFKTLDTRHDNPLNLIDEFIGVIQVNKNQDFIFKSGIDRSIVVIIRKIQRKIYEKMNSILSPMAEVLKRVYPLPTMEELENFKKKIETINKKNSDIKAYYHAFGIFLDPHKQQLKEIDKLIEAEELILKKKSNEAGEVIHRECSFDYSVQNQLRMVNYYYEKVHNQKWNEANWRSFFNKYFESIVGKGIRLKYKEILDEYETLFKENLTRIQPYCLGEHYKIFIHHLKENHMLPYIMYISDNSDAAALYKIIREKESVKKLFSIFLNYLIHHCIWPKYVELYKLIDASLKKIFGNVPLKLPREDLEKRYNEIKDVFLKTLTISPKLEESYNLIPPDKEFTRIQDKFKGIIERIENFENVNHAFERYKTINIWVSDRFLTELTKLKSKCNIFSNEWTSIRLQMGWEDTIHILKKMYARGRCLLEKFNLGTGPGIEGIDSLEAFEAKATVRYSEQLHFFLNKFLELWQEFNGCARELAGETGPVTISNIFNEEYFRGFKEKWQTLEFHRLWVREKLPEPGNLDQFFAVFRRVLDNHKNFREYLHAETVGENLDRFKTLDPFINLMLDNLVERGLLKTRGAR